MAKPNNSYVEIEGFKKWDPYYDFAKDLYSDVRSAIAQKDFEMAKRCMRELIDNTIPYHNQSIEVQFKQGDEIKKQSIDYIEYFELCVEKYEDAINKEGNRHLSPDEKEEIHQQKDNFYQKMRYIRRLVMKDLSKAGIIPTAQTKKEQKVNSLLRSE